MVLRKTLVVSVPVRMWPLLDSSNDSLSRFFCGQRQVRPNKEEPISSLIYVAAGY